eukprot:TRINITY_DN1537_c0_g1_i3.p1 TRINITY_DN1537_c0_g1~~TRINITY_DN1537_c0_g1_i3.p1  ORF type:complete len:272 (-),score=27.13 TRINITY_DN1537_c0_g1_i3:120-935(-)
MDHSNKNSNDNINDSDIGDNILSEPVVWVSLASLMVTNCTFDSWASPIGAASNEPDQNCTLSINNSIFRNSGFTPVQVSNNTVFENNISDEAGPVLISGSEARLFRTTFSGNLAYNNATAVVIKRKANVTMEECLFTSDSTENRLYQMVIYCTASSLVISDSQFLDDGRFRSDIVADSGSNLTVIRCSFSGVGYRPIIFASGVSTLFLSETIFTGFMLNSDSVVYVEQSYDVTIAQCVFFNNTVSYNPYYPYQIKLDTSHLWRSPLVSSNP